MRRFLWMDYRNIVCKIFRQAYYCSLFFIASIGGLLWRLESKQTREQKGASRIWRHEIGQKGKKAGHVAIFTYGNYIFLPWKS